MSEIIFILTTIYVAYVIYTAADSAKKQVQAHKSAHVDTIMTPSGSIPVTESTIAPAKKSAPVPEVKVEQTAAQEATPPVSSNELRHPETGETAKVSNNYRGLKRWLTEALVAEGFAGKSLREC